MADGSDFEELQKELRTAADDGHPAAEDVLRQVDEYVEAGDATPEHREGVLGALSDAVYQFEADHPRLTAAIQKVVDSLTAGGI